MISVLCIPARSSENIPASEKPFSRPANERPKTELSFWQRARIRSILRDYEAGIWSTQRAWDQLMRAGLPAGEAADTLLETIRFRL